MKKLSVLLVAVLIVSMLPAAALAQETPADVDGAGERLIEKLKDRAEQAIEKRLETIERVTKALGDVQHLTDEHERILLSELAAASNGLTALGREIESAETIAELRELIPSIFEDYRIYVVAVPKAHLVAVADTVVAAVDRLELVAGSLQDTINRLKEAGFDTSEAEVVLGQMQAFLGDASASAGPVPDAELRLAPADWPDPAKGILQGAHSDVRSARGDVSSAVRSAHEIARILRDLLREGGAT